MRWRRANIVHNSRRENDALALKGHGMSLLYQRFLHIHTQICGTYIDITSKIEEAIKLTGLNCGTNPCACTTSAMRIALKSAKKNCISLSIEFVFNDEHSNPLNNPSSVYGRVRLINFITSLLFSAIILVNQSDPNYKNRKGTARAQ